MATETIPRRRAEDADLHTGAMVVSADDGNFYEVVARRIREGVHEVMVEDLSTPTPDERLESRLANAGRCTAQPVRQWREVREVVGMQLVRAPVSLTRFTA